MNKRIKSILFLLGGMVVITGAIVIAPQVKMYMEEKSDLPIRVESIYEETENETVTKVNTLQYDKFTYLKEVLNDDNYDGAISLMFPNKGSSEKNNRVTIDDENERYSVILDLEDGQEPTEMTFNTRAEILNWLELVGLI